MRYVQNLFFLIVFFSWLKAGLAQDHVMAANNQPDDLYTLWDVDKYDIAFAADSIAWLTQVEKDVYYYLNLARMNPSLFARTFAKDYEHSREFVKAYEWDKRKHSLIREMLAMPPAPPVYPDKTIFELAACFASSAGFSGAQGHDRGKSGCPTGYGAECVQLGGPHDGLSIVMAWLIDAGEQNAALLHRRIMLDPKRTLLGVAIRPHKDYGFIAVADFALQ